MIELSAERKGLFKRLESIVGNTPLYEIKNIKIPNGCRILCKEENKNPTGSHYDRFWVEYFRELETKEDARTKKAIINSENMHEKPIIETTTGNSGASFAWISRALGYKDYRVVIPKDMPYSRKKQIESYGASLIESNEKQYVRGVIKTFKEYIKHKIGAYIIPNHAAQNDMNFQSMQNIGDEIIQNMPSDIKNVDFFISALGNGLTTKGIGSSLKKQYELKIIGVEPKECPTFFYKKLNNEIKHNKEFTHKMYGSGTGDIEDFDFPILKNFLSCIDDIKLVSECEWKNALQKLEDYEGKFVGHTSAACFFTALKLADDINNKDKVFVIVFYDSDWKYYD